MKRVCWGLCALFCLIVLTTAVAKVPAADSEDEQLVTLTLNLLGDKDKDVRALGLEQVRTKAKGRAATELFAAELPKLPPDAQASLLTALADRGDSAARPAVLALFKESKDQPVRIAALEALGTLGQEADTLLLVKALSGKIKSEQAAARESLVKLPGKAVPKAIVGQLKEASPPIRATLIEILALRHARETIPDLLTAAVDASPAVRGAAMTALGQMAQPADLPGMVQGVLKAENGPERVAAERAVALVCQQNADASQRVVPLLAITAKLNNADQLALLPALGRVGGPAALKVIEAAIASSPPEEHEMGLRALCNWPTAATSPRLIELAQTDPHPEHRALALKALIRVAPLPDGRTDAQRLELVEKTMSLCSSDAERNQMLQRASAVRSVEMLRFVVPYLAKPALAQAACEAVVELAHHRQLREPNKAEFDRALDTVIRTSKDPVVVDRAGRYKRNETWTRPTAPQGK